MHERFTQAHLKTNFGHLVTFWFW